LIIEVGDIKICVHLLLKVETNKVQGFPTHSFQNLAPIFFVITLKLFIHRGFQFIHQALFIIKILPQNQNIFMNN
jgi:hypothetical protein